MRHPNLVLLMGGIFQQGQVCILMDLGDKNLSSILKDESVNLFKRIDLSINIAKGVNWLHESKPPLIHYNLKPNNIIVKKTHFPALFLSFGI